MVVVLLPMLAGWVTRKLLVKRYGKETYQKQFKQKFPMLSTLGVLGWSMVRLCVTCRLRWQLP